jgi:signal transduction histidine kinase
VNNLTHELKTPISTIALACEALTDPGMPKSPDQMNTFVGMIRDENKRLGVAGRERAAERRAGQRQDAHQTGRPGPACAC